MGPSLNRMRKSLRGFIRLPAMRYETELYSVLLLIVLFLVLISLSSIRLSSHVRGIFEDQIFADLLKTSQITANYLSDKPELKSSTAEFRQWVNDSFADSIELIEGTALASDRMSPIVGRLSETQIAMLDEGEPASIMPDNKDRWPGYAVLYPFKSEDNRPYLLRVYKRASRFGMIGKVSLLNYIFQITGLIAIIILGYLYVKVTLKPFTRMKRAAREATVEAMGDDVSVESIVVSFQKMIDEMKDKEEILQGLYKKTQKRAEQLEQFNEYILSGMASGLMSCNRDGIVTHFNLSAQRLLQIEERDALGCSYTEVLSDIPEMRDLIGRTLDEGLNQSRVELSLIHDDEDMSLGVSTTLIRDERERRIGVTVIMTDLTEVKKLQRDIAYKDKMAALGETAAGLAHELRNSMTAVLGFGNLIKKLSEENPQLMQVAESISTEASATEQMLTRFLEFAQPTNFSIAPVDICETTHELITNFKNIAEEKNIRLSCFCEEGSGVLADRLALRQIISNLLSNAVDATLSEGEVSMDIRSTGHGTIQIRVSDGGPGIQPEYRNKVFNPFFTTKEDGTGLGLCTVKKFVDGMRGKISLSQEDAERFEIMVELPQADDTQDEFITEADQKRLAQAP